MTFSEAAWTSVKPWFDAIMIHPFVVSLSEGTLPADVFERYLLDDAHFLVGFATALAMLATRAETPDVQAMLAQASADTLASERLLHRRFLMPRGIDPDALGVDEASPTCRAYVGTVATDAAFAPAEVGMAGALPCFRVYAEIGHVMLAAEPAPDHPYREWIQTYADPDFDRTVLRLEAAIDALADEASEKHREEMLALYQRATRFEWMFWDAAWRGERWPDPVSESAEARESQRRMSRAG